MTSITTEEAETLAKQADNLGYFRCADVLISLAAERDLADEQIKGLSEERERWKDRAEKAEAEAEKLREQLHQVRYHRGSGDTIPRDLITRGD